MNMINELLDNISPIEQAKTDAKMLIASRIADAMAAKSWRNKDLLAAMNRQTPSIVTKWLSGTHNFTIDTLVELEQVLDISLLYIGREAENINISTYSLPQNENRASLSVHEPTRPLENDAQ